MLTRGRSRRIRVQSECNLLCKFFQLLNVLFSDSTANTCYRLFCPVLMSYNRVHVPFNNNDLFCQLYGIARHIQGVQHTVFFKQYRLRSVEVLRLTLTQSTSAEPNHPTSPIPD